MGQKSIANTPDLAKLIRLRRNELNLTIEAAALKAGVGTKTWSRYEAGESIRKDKYIGICRALNWSTLPFENDFDFGNKMNFDDFKTHNAWSTFLENTFGECVATSFVIGSDILLDHIQEDMEALASMRCKSHIGEIGCSWLSFMLPKQFLMKYDYEFLYALHSSVLSIIENAHLGNQLVAHRVIDELALHLIVEESKFMMESVEEKDDNWDEWYFDIFDDMDLITYLFSDMYLTYDDVYHFDRWLDRQFYCD